MTSWVVALQTVLETAEPVTLCWAAVMRSVRLWPDMAVLEASAAPLLPQGPGREDYAGGWSWTDSSPRRAAGGPRSALRDGPVTRAGTPPPPTPLPQPPSPPPRAFRSAGDRGHTLGAAGKWRQRGSSSELSGRPASRDLSATPTWHAPRPPPPLTPPTTTADGVRCEALRARKGAESRGAWLPSARVWRVGAAEGRWRLPALRRGGSRSWRRVGTAPSSGSYLWGDRGVGICSGVSRVTLAKGCKTSGVVRKFFVFLGLESAMEIPWVVLWTMETWRRVLCEGCEELGAEWLLHSSSSVIFESSQIYIISK